jgi:hypothetical protein
MPGPIGSGISVREEYKLTSAVAFIYLWASYDAREDAERGMGNKESRGGGHVA